MGFVKRTDQFHLAGSSIFCCLLLDLSFVLKSVFSKALLHVTHATELFDWVHGDFAVGATTVVVATTTTALLVLNHLLKDAERISVWIKHSH